VTYSSTCLEWKERGENFIVESVGDFSAGNKTPAALQNKFGSGAAVSAAMVAPELVMSCAPP
jgi:hypothetical protein